MGVGSLRRSFSISVVVHAFFFSAWLLLFAQRATQISPFNKYTLVEIEPVKKHRDTTQPRIVQTERGEKVDQADPHAFLGFQNQHVDSQTVSKNHTIKLGQSTNNQAKSRAEEEKKSATRSILQHEGALSNLGVPLLPKASELKDKSPVEQRSNWAEFSSRPEDYIPGTKESDRTALNTKEFQFYGYFQRIRSRLDQAWIPILRTKLVSFYKNGRQLASDMDHTTKILVVLNADGQVVRVKLKAESGTRELDEAAVKAFNQAGPFPNPPRGIMDPNGEIQIPWDFILKT